MVTVHTCMWARVCDSDLGVGYLQISLLRVCEIVWMVVGFGDYFSLMLLVFLFMLCLYLPSLMFFSFFFRVFFFLVLVSCGVCFLNLLYCIVYHSLVVSQIECLDSYLFSFLLSFC